MQIRRCLLALICLPLIGCTKFQILDSLVPHCGYDRTLGQAYGSAARQKLDVYRPANSANQLPVVIFFYGGSWQNGDRADYRFVAQALASRGYVAIIPDYRLYPSVTFPAFVEDGAAAVRWTHDNIARFGGDPHRIYLMGHSAGAYIAVLLTLDAHYLEAVGLSRSDIRATAGLSGPYDFIPDVEVRGVFSMPPGDAPAPIDPKIEPITFAAGDAPPLLLLQGAKDTTVDPDNAQKLADRIRSAGGQVRHIVYHGVDHPGVVLALAFPFRWIAPVLDDTLVFFQNHR